MSTFFSYSQIWVKFIWWTLGQSVEQLTHDPVDKGSNTHNVIRLKVSWSNVLVVSQLLRPLHLTQLPSSLLTVILLVLTISPTDVTITGQLNAIWPIYFWPNDLLSSNTAPADTRFKNVISNFLCAFMSTFFSPQKWNDKWSKII